MGFFASLLTAEIADEKRQAGLLNSVFTSAQPVQYAIILGVYHFLLPFSSSTEKKARVLFFFIFAKNFKTSSAFFLLLSRFARSLHTPSESLDASNLISTSLRRIKPLHPACDGRMEEVRRAKKPSRKKPAKVNV